MESLKNSVVFCPNKAYNKICMTKNKSSEREEYSEF